MLLSKVHGGSLRSFVSIAVDVDMGMSGAGFTYNLQPSVGLWLALKRRLDAANDLTEAVHYG